MKVWRNISLWYRFKTCHSDNKEWFVPCSVFDVQFYSQNKNLLKILILDWCIIDHPLVEILISMATLNLSLVSKTWYWPPQLISGPKFWPKTHFWTKIPKDLLLCMAIFKGYLARLTRWGEGHKIGILVNMIQPFFC